MTIEILAYLGIFILIVNFILFFKSSFKQEKAFKVFTFYLMVMVIIQIITSVFQAMQKNNLFLSHFYFVLQFLILSYFYLQIVKTGFQKNAVKIMVPLCLTVLAIQYYFDQALFFKFNLFEIFITSFLIIIFSMFHLYNILNEKKYYYYISIGVLVYLFGSTFLFITGNLMTTLSTDLRSMVWIINNVLYLFYQIFIFVEFKQMILNKKQTHE